MVFGADRLPQTEPTLGAFQTDVLEGLSAPIKRIPCKYLYDQEGSELFNRICELPEYYLTRLEQEILDANAAEISADLGPGVALIEFGSGSAVKTERLLDALFDPAGYLPVDIAPSILSDASQRIASRYPGLEVVPICADYTADFTVPKLEAPMRKQVVFFPGSTIGNFHPTQAQAFLASTRRKLETGSGLLIGVDLQKDPRVLHAAYNDATGVTAGFNLNLLTRINRELDGDFDLKQFVHYAPFDPKTGRVEMHLISGVRQMVHAAGGQFHFAPGESIFTEVSYKYTFEQFASVAYGAGYLLRRSWTDEDRWFCIFYFEAL